MAMTKDQIKASYPLPVYNFRVEINGEAIGFTEVSGLNIAYDTITHIESATRGAGPRMLYMPGKPKITTLTLKKGESGATMRTRRGKRSMLRNESRACACVKGS